MDLRFDHFLTFANTKNIDEYVEKYRALGFVVTDETRPYKPGLRNRFVLLGCEYLELAWVENEGEFAAGGSEEFARMYEDLPALRKAARPFSIGMSTPDVEALNKAWTGRGFELPATWSFAPPGMAPILSFQEVPQEIMPGASCFAITYHVGSTSKVRSIRRAPNTTYAVEGITLVSSNPAEAAQHWRTLLAPETANAPESGVYSVLVSPHTARWMSPQIFQERYGLAWTPSPHRYGDLAAIHLLADDLDLAETMLGQRVLRKFDNIGQGKNLLVSPTGADGVIFMIREYPMERWRNERSKVTGEEIVIT